MPSLSQCFKFIQSGVSRCWRACYRRIRRNDSESTAIHNDHNTTDYQTIDIPSTSIGSGSSTLSLRESLSASFTPTLFIQLTQNFFRDFVWPVVTAFAATFRSLPAGQWAQFFSETGVQMLSGIASIFTGTLLALGVLRCRHTPLRPLLLQSFATGLAAVLSILTWNLALYLGINSSENAYQFNRANWIASIFTGLAEGATQLLIPWLINAIDSLKNNGCPELPSCSRTAVTSVLLNTFIKIPTTLLFNSVAGAAWQLVYFQYAKSFLTDGNTDPRSFSGLVTAAVEAEPGLSIGLGAAIAAAVFGCNALVPTIGLGIVAYTANKAWDCLSSKCCHRASLTSNAVSATLTTTN